mgnify:CR=1 FL=1
MRFHVSSSGIWLLCEVCGNVATRLVACEHTGELIAVCGSCYTDVIKSGCMRDMSVPDSELVLKVVVK